MCSLILSLPQIVSFLHSNLILSSKAACLDKDSTCIIEASIKRPTYHCNTFSAPLWKYKATGSRLHWKSSVDYRMFGVQHFWLYHSIKARNGENIPAFYKVVFERASCSTVAHLWCAVRFSFGLAQASVQVVCHDSPKLLSW